MRTALLLACLATTAACGGVAFHPADRVDADGDGFFAPGDAASLDGLTVDELREAALDCDDNDDNVFPGAAELCDGKDNDCNRVASAVEQDDDGDGFTECGWDPQAGLVTTLSDCNDDPAAFGQYQAPGREEVCGMPPVSGLAPPGSLDEQRPRVGIDDNCDGDLFAGEVDNDQDGHADACELVDLDDPEAPPLAEDCDDTDPGINPSQETSSCIEGVDYGTDCQPADQSERINWYADFDRDGDGDPGTVEELCANSQPGNFDGTNWLEDFDPTNAPVPHDDCNPSDALLNSLDRDGDGFSTCQGDLYPTGDADDPSRPCSALAAPGNTEVCDACDNDLDGKVDQTFDQDGDNSYTDPASGPAGENGCVFSGAYLGDEIDCDDLDPTLNGLDLDGDGSSPCQGDCDDNDGSISQSDNDLDGYFTCSPPVDCNDNDPVLVPVDIDGDGFTPCEGDCDDANPLAFPGATAQCDGIADTNCDGQLDPFDQDDDADGANECGGDCDDTDSALNLLDADGDGWTTCNGDCLENQTNPLSPVTYPGAPQACDDSTDNDCNGVADPNQADLDGDGDDLCSGDCNDQNGALDSLDVDGDGNSSCAGDCDDADPSVTATTDADSDGWTACGTVGVLPDCDDGNAALNHSDADGDGNSTCAAAPDCDDHDPTADELDLDGDGVTSCDGDCADGDAAILPSAAEPRDGIDNDCDGTADEGLLLGGELVISEILVSPDAATADELAEYVEIYNPTAQPVDLRGWTIVVANTATAGTSTWTFNSNPAPSSAVVVDPAERIVFARSRNYLAFGTDIADYHWGASTFGDNGGQITLRFGGVDIDTVSWTTSGCVDACQPGSVAPQYDTDSTWRPGHAMGLSDAALTGADPDIANDDAFNWCEERDPLAASVYGSPGAAPVALGPCEAN